MASQTYTETIPAEPTMHMKLSHNVPHPPVGSKATNTLRMKNLKLDPTRALEPARKKLATIEAQRIMAVFEESIKRAEIVTALPYIMENMHRFKVSLGSELVDMLNQHERIQQSYKDARGQLDIFLEKRAALAKRIEMKNAAAAAAAAAAAREKEMSEMEKMFDDYEEEEEEEEDGEGEDGEAGEAEGETTEKDVQTIPADDNTSALANETGLQPKSAISADKEDVATNVGEMVTEQITEIRASNSSSRSSSQLSMYEPRIEEAMRNLGLVAQQVSHSCKNILRLFSTNPTAMKVVTTDSNIRDEGGQDLVNNMIELRDILMHKLLTTPEEETERMAYLDEISKRERQNAAIIEKQEKDLKEAIDDKEEEIRKKNDIIKRLQTDLHQIEKFSDENIRRTRAEAEKQEIADNKNSDQKTQRLQSEINQLQSQLNNSVSEHRDIEAELRGKKYKIENEVDNWIQKYDQDLGERQDEFEEINLVYTEEKQQLKELEERFATLEKEYTGIMEERRVARDKRERAQRELAILVKSATTIQAFWRSYKVRKALKAKSKKKGGKKKSAS